MISRSLALLILCNLIWSFHPLLSKSVLESFSPANAAFLRYGSALVAYLGIAIAVQLRPASGKVEFFAWPKSPKDALLIFILGALPFGVSPILALTGLADAQAIENAVLIAVEPLFCVVLAWIFLGERLRTAQWLAFAGALAGFLLLSQFQGLFLPGAAVSFLPIFLMMISLWGEATYSVAGRKLVQNYSPLPLYGSAILVGAAFLGAYSSLDPATPSLMAEFREAKATSIASVFYLGPLGTTVGYLVWIRVARVLPVAPAALTLFVQPVFGTILGFVIRDESFTLVQWAGAALILLSVAFQTLWQLRNLPEN